MRPMLITIIHIRFLMGIIHEIHHIYYFFAGMQAQTATDTLKHSISAFGGRRKDDMMQFTNIHTGAECAVNRTRLESRPAPSLSAH